MSNGNDGLPFDPPDVNVDDLPEVLAEIEDVETLHALQEADTRTTAAAHYERRVNALQGAAEEDLDGITIGTWGPGLRNYKCDFCGYASLDEAQTQAHVVTHHRAELRELRAAAES